MKLIKFTQFILFMIFIVNANANAKTSRQEVINELNNMQTNWYESQFKSSINNNQLDTLKIGDNVVFDFLSQEEAYLTIVHVDAYGVMNISFPLMTNVGEEMLSAGKHRLLPNASDDFTIEVEPPIGKDSIFVLATKTPIDKKLLGLSDLETSIPLEESMLFIRDLNHSLESKN